MQLEHVEFLNPKLSRLGANGEALRGNRIRILIPGSEKIGLDFRAIIYNHMVVDELSNVFAALSDPTRRRILDRLTHGPAIVNDLVQRFEISQQGISKHVAYLERAHLIVKVKRGREHVCTLKVDAVREVAEWAEGYRRFWEARLDKFGEALARKRTGKQTKETRT